MADITVTAANVAAVSGFAATDVSLVQVGEAVTPGAVLYLAADGKWYLGNNITSAITAGSNGVRYCLSYADADEYASVLNKRGAVVAAGGTLVAGDSYYLSVSGAIAPETDHASNDYVTRIGIAATTANLQLDIRYTGIQVP